MRHLLNSLALSLVLATPGGNAATRGIQALRVWSPECVKVGETFRVKVYATGFGAVPLVLPDGLRADSTAAQVQPVSAGWGQTHFPVRAEQPGAWSVRVRAEGRELRRSVRVVSSVSVALSQAVESVLQPPAGRVPEEPVDLVGLRRYSRFRAAVGTAAAQGVAFSRAPVWAHVPAEEEQRLATFCALAGLRPPAFL